MSQADFAYAVKGRRPFPLDMLRRDQSRPATPEDALLVERLSREEDIDGVDFRAVHVVNLVIPEAGSQRPNTARWESFRWEVPNDEARLAERLDAEADLRREAHLRSALAKLTPEEVEAVEWNAARKVCV